MKKQANSLGLMAALGLFLGGACGLAAPVSAPSPATARIRVDPGHPWRPPFGLDRVGAPLRVEVDPGLGQALSPEYWLVGYAEGKEIERQALRLTNKPPARRQVTMSGDPEELALVAITEADGSELWRQRVRVMVVQAAPVWPAFGAVQTKLRYDAPIEAIRAGQPAFLDYEGAWDAQLRDVVVCLPNGARFVFWRGSSYIPFWAGRCNTGLCYEWAERLTPNDGFTDCPEPLMDKELRYGRVEIVESTAARVRVRWQYQSCDLNYKVNGDLPVEDYCFYPDGFGTRTLELTSIPEANYELNEFIVLTPQAAFPFDVLPPNLVDILSLEGAKAEFRFPCFPEEQPAEFKKLTGNERPIYRIRLSKHDTLQGVQFCPWGGGPMPPGFGPFYDRGYLVTPTYWGGHWPLSRGLSTGAAISDRIRLSPAHNSIMTAADNRPQPIRSLRVQTRDALGQEKTMKRETWVWLIGMTDANDVELVRWARSFAQPPTLELDGARQDSEPYSPERRALRLVVEARGGITIVIKPAGCCVNPVFELRDAPKSIAKLQVGDRTLNPGQYAWDGRTLWLSAQLSQPTAVRLEFGP